MSSKKGKKRKPKLARPPRKPKEPDGLTGFDDVLLPFPPADDDVVDSDIAGFQRDKDRMMRAIGQALQSQNFESEEEAQAFLSSLTGKKLDEIMDVLPESPEAEVLGELNKVYEAATDAEAENLARIVVKKYPRSLDAHLAHARHASTLAAAVRRYQKAVSLGEETLAHLIEESEGHLWGFHEARPWLSAKFELAEAYELQERDDKAAELFRDVLRLNEGDNQGARFALMRLLLSGNRDAEARELYFDYEDDISCMWTYSRALLAFRRTQERHPWELTEFDLVRAVRAKESPEIPAAYDQVQPYLERALDNNPHMARLILFPHCAPDDYPSAYSAGSEEEALCYFRDLIPGWHSEAASYIWLFSVTSEWVIENDCADLLDDVPPPPKEIL